MLPLIDLFSTPYNPWKEELERREDILSITNVERLNYLKTMSNTCINNAFDAAYHTIKSNMGNHIGGHINELLRASPEFKVWRKFMPSRIPNELRNYQIIYKYCDLSVVNEEIIMHGKLLPDNQVLFHGGHLLFDNVIVTDRPLSATFCPQVAIANSLHLGKAYDARRVVLCILRFLKCSAKAYVYKQVGTNQGHEKEVVISSGAVLKIRNGNLVKDDFPLHKYNYPERRVPIYVLEIDVSSVQFCDS